ncbi:phospholipase D-like domain-containing protein [Ideonella sp. BN130291]|uniref:phospholipase D-like domain-containing protein n=1 Tax=Ideonella sp. BN130291 TaxID=3112940 RepID=UPI002E26B90E|nr:phospholipase D-like domain-containing protein [Ideonella sp. BN130291]
MSSDGFDYPELTSSANAVVRPGSPTAYKTVVARHAPLRRQQSDSSAFAPERQGNKVKPFVTGEAYFADVCAAIQSARKSVFITGWQVNWAVKLQGQTRLIDALAAAVKGGAKVYVMPWQSPKVGLNTGDLGTMLAVFQLNAGRKDGLRAFCCPAGLQNDLSGIEETFFSHHQKLVVIDGSIAYVGGIDLAFGRRDDHRFSLAHEWRTGPEVYNTGVPPSHKLLPAEATAYVDEMELLRSTLAVGPLKQVLNAQTSAGNQAAQSPLGRSVDAVAAWWREPISVEGLPRWLRTPVQWGQAGVKAAAAPARSLFDQAQQRAADAAVRELNGGAIPEGKLLDALSLARTAVRSTYNALLAISWANEEPNAEMLQAGAQSTPGGDATFAADQPRMPWQDVHVRIEGPSVYDLARNFVGRWNSVQRSYLLGPLETYTRIQAELLPPKPAAGQGNGGSGGVAVRVLRSAPLQLQRDEARATPGSAPPVAAQTEIHDAMVSAIRRAERFVYIENQFFQSSFGTPSIDPDDVAAMSGPMRYLLASPANRVSAAVTRASARHGRLAPKNHIGRALADRIEHAIRWGQPFHVYMVLPVHPEGSLADLAIVGQIHWTMQSLVFASDSLINRVRLALYAKANCKEPRSNSQWEEAKRKGLEIDPQKNQPAFAKINRAAVSPYLTLLNLRAAQTVGGKVRTEQVYVHSKLLIVDDRIVIVGSANINDRSLAGGRDSELAVLMMDLSAVEAPIDGRNPIKVRKLAHELRKDLWRKHFALGAANDIVKPASQLAGLLDKPADPVTWKAIQAVANANSKAYAAAFDWVPGSSSSIWPVWNRDRKFSAESVQTDYKMVQETLSPFASRMPFSEDFWKPGTSQSRTPVGVQGFICELPIDWTEGENNHPGMNMILLTELERGNAPNTIIVAASPTPNNDQAPT